MASDDLTPVSCFCSGPDRGSGNEEPAGQLVSPAGQWNGVDLYYLNALAPLGDTDLACLSDEEQALFARAPVARIRRQKQAFRVAVRQILAGFCRKKPCELVFSHTENGKPFLDRRNYPDPPHFSLSHSRDLAVLAISPQPDGPVGVDIERCRHIPPSLVRRCSPGEQQALAGLEGETFDRIFLGYWTRKEAVIKAMGSTLGQWLHRLEVPLPAGGSGEQFLPTGDAGTGNSEAGSWQKWQVATRVLDGATAGETIRAEACILSLARPRF